MSVAEATRPVYWNLSHVWVMYVLLVPTLLVAGMGVYRQARRWLQGRPLAGRFDRLPQRLRLLLRHAVAQGRTRRRPYAGAFHLAVFAGFAVLTVATLVVFVHEDLGLPIMRGGFYLYFQSLVVDVLGLFFVLGLGMAALRRWLRPPPELVRSGEADLLLVLLLTIGVTGFLLEGWRIAVTRDPWGPFSPVGYAVARLAESLQSVELMTAAHAVVWWLHLVLVFAFLAWAPYTRMFHALTAPLNIFTANLDGYARSLKVLDFESEDTLGVARLGDFSWKDLLELDACTECGRCTAACPANAVGKSLSPRDVVLDLRALLRRPPPGPGPSAEEALGSPILHPDTAVSEEALWQCTTCAACLEACPVFVEPMAKIVDARRYLVMEEADFPRGLQEVVTSLEERGHPFRGTSFSRLDWARGLDVPVLAELEDPGEAEVLLWVGCGGALVERNHSVLRSLVRLLQTAGVSFAVLGREESCTGDPARRLGHEYLFETLARTVQESLDRYQVRTLVTACPHCFSTFRNDYPHLGGRYEVLHHSELLARLVEEGRLRPEEPTELTVTFHDPCYLGRYNGVFDAPRHLAELSSTSSVREMEQNRRDSFCCGGGGGLCFVDEPPHQRVNQERSRQALATGADVVAVACPFCMTMLEDGTRSVGGESTRVLDVAELLWQAVEGGGRKPTDPA